MEKIIKLRSFDCETNSPCQYQREYVGKSKEKINIDVGV